MASSSRMISRLTTRLQPFVIKLNKTPSASAFTPLLKPRSSLFRLPVELSCCLETMLPLHSAIASARLTSSLSIESQSWGIVPQGISMPL
ncbi:hypothetical protein Leryth_020732 [Lithospermum erythrorhizon]|nr:hypothetical protein Leryth_020732 [Lithospermum erythrorhizon]